MYLKENDGAKFHCSLLLFLFSTETLNFIKSLITTGIILTGKPIGKRPLGRPRRRWEDNIVMDLIEIAINTRDWVDSPQDKDYWKALVNVALNLLVPEAMDLVNFTV